MELVMFIGIPGSGKSSFHKANFFNTHMRISLDLFNTRNKERRFMELAFMLQQQMVVDNTNVTAIERAKYIAPAKANLFKVTGYYFESKLSVCLERNEQRLDKERINRVGVIAKYKELERPRQEEGFDKLYYVNIEDNEYKIKNWINEI